VAKMLFGTSIEIYNTYKTLKKFAKLFQKCGRGSFGR